MQLHRQLCLAALRVIAALPAFTQDSVRAQKPEIPRIAYVAVCTTTLGWDMPLWLSWASRWGTTSTRTVR